MWCHCGAASVPRRVVSGQVRVTACCLLTVCLCVICLLLQVCQAVAPAHQGCSTADHACRLCRRGSVTSCCSHCQHSHRQ